MKKTFKKLMAALLAVALLCAMAVPAMAATGNKTDNRGSITISPAAVGETYDIYQMFVLDQFDTEKQEYTYTVNSNWASFFATGADGAEYIKLNNNHPIWIKSNNDEATAGEFAKKAIAWATENDVSPATSKKADSTTVKFDDLQLGYYLVDTSLGALCNLTTTDADAQINEKNEKPSIDKKINVNGAPAVESTAKVGDVVNYEVTVTVAKGSTGYVVRDTMSTGLTFDKDSVKVDGEALTATVGTLTTPADGYTFTLALADSYIQSVGAANTIKVTYSATINKDAVIANNVTNKASLKYGNGSESVSEKVTTTLYQFDLVKLDGTTNKLLADAKFKLYASTDGNDEIPLVKDTDGSYRVAVGDEAGVDIVTTDSAPIRIKGLDKKVYYLAETEAPQGYNAVSGRITVDLLSGSKTVTGTINNTTIYENTMGGVPVVNNAGATLPSTGGMGTTLFYVIGGGLMVAAVVLLVTKKRMENK